LVAGCSPVPSTNFETSRLSINTDVFIDVDLQETEFISKVSLSGRPVNLVDGDRLIVHYQDQSTRASQTDDGEYRVSFPFVSTGEYRIELSRPRDVSAPNTREARTNDGISLTTFYGLEISAAACQNDTGDSIVSFDIALTPSINTIRDLVTPILSGSVYSRPVDVTTVLDRLENMNDTDQAIHQCNIDADLFSQSNTRPPSQQLESKPVVIFVDPILAGGSGDYTVRSNSAKITLFR